MQVGKTGSFICSKAVYVVSNIGLAFAASVVYRRGSCSLRSVLDDVKGELRDQETETHASWLTTGSTRPFRPGLPLEQWLR
jgi:hypothetical protein